MANPDILMTLKEVGEMKLFGKTPEEIRRYIDYFEARNGTGTEPMGAFAVPKATTTTPASLAKTLSGMIDKHMTFVRVVHEIDTRSIMVENYVGRKFTVTVTDA